MPTPDLNKTSDTDEESDGVQRSVHPPQTGRSSRNERPPRSARALMRWNGTWWPELRAGSGSCTPSIRP
jgi:hypothetical protein